MVSGNPNTIGTFGELPNEREEWIEDGEDWYVLYQCGHCSADFDSKEKVMKHLEDAHYEAWKESQGGA
jgi:hypothetical protein